VFGVSVDSVYSHGAFAKELGGLPFELIADFERRMVDAWGVRRTDLEGYDGVPRRTIFILDPELKVRWRWITSPEQRLPDTMEVLAEAMKVGKAPAKQTPKASARKTKKAPNP
jgi:peroxiredoxin